MGKWYPNYNVLVRFPVQRSSRVDMKGLEKVGLCILWKASECAFSIFSS